MRMIFHFLYTNWSNYNYISATGLYVSCIACLVYIICLAKSSLKGEGDVCRQHICEWIRILIFEALKFQTKNLLEV